MHSSFAYYAPFVDRLVTSKKRLNDSTSTSVDVSIGTSHLVDKSVSFSEKEAGSLDGPRPKPTVLEIARMKRGAQKASRLSQIAAKFDTFDE